MYQVYVKCDHVSLADVKMSRAIEIEIIAGGDDEPAGYIHICSSCKAVFGARFSDTVDM